MHQLDAAILAIVALAGPAAENATCLDVPVTISVAGQDDTRNIKIFRYDIKLISSILINGCSAASIKSANQREIVTRSGLGYTLAGDRFYPADETSVASPEDALPIDKGPRLNGRLPTFIVRSQDGDLGAKWVAVWNTSNRHIVGTFSIPHHNKPTILVSVRNPVISANIKASSPDTRQVDITVLTRDVNGLAKILYFRWLR